MDVHLERTRETVTLVTPPFAGGGEADLHAVRGDTSRALKLYKPAMRTKERETKAGLQCRLPSPDRRLVWPLGRVYDRPSGQFLGIELERLAGRYLTVLALLTARARRHHGVYLSFAERLRLAAELADIVDAIHRTPTLVVGDLNPTNWLVLVLPAGRLVLPICLRGIDSDSYQYTARDPRTGRAVTYTPGVGVTEYLARELQGLPSLRGVARTPEQDRFALACLCWLFVKDAHPFTAHHPAGTAGPQSVAEWIRNGWFPHAPAAAPPAGWHAVDEGVPFRSLPPGVRDLVVRTFKDGHNDPSARGTAAQWRDVLADWADAVDRAAHYRGNWLTAAFRTTATYRALEPHVKRTRRAINAAVAWTRSLRPQDQVRAWAARPDLWRKAAGVALIAAGLTVVPSLRPTAPTPVARHRDAAAPAARPTLKPLPPGTFDWQDAPPEWRALGDSRGEAPK